MGIIDTIRFGVAKRLRFKFTEIRQVFRVAHPHSESFFLGQRANSTNDKVTPACMVFVIQSQHLNQNFSIIIQGYNFPVIANHDTLPKSHFAWVRNKVATLEDIARVANVKEVFVDEYS